MRPCYLAKMSCPPWHCLIILSNPGDSEKMSVRICVNFEPCCNGTATQMQGQSHTTFCSAFLLFFSSGVRPVCGCCGGLCFIWYFSALLLCLTDFQIHRECRVCLGSRNLYSPVRRAVQKIFGLIFILASGNFLLCFKGVGRENM